MSLEIWRNVTDAYGYEVSNLGRVRSWRRKGSRISSTLSNQPKLLKISPNACGYPVVNISRNGDKQKPVAVHILVMSAFTGPCPQGLEVLHEDGTRDNCILRNLSYGTRADNCQDSIRHGTSIRPSIRGIDNCNGILTTKEVRTIKRLIKKGEGTAEIARTFDVHPNTIDSIKAGRSWKWLNP